MKHEVAKLFQIVEKKKLNDAVTMVRIAAPLIAKKVLPGQFIIFRLDEFGERVPLTVADYDREGGTITLIFQAAGESTRQFAALEAGDAILDLVGPLGVPTELPEGTKSVWRRWMRNRLSPGKASAQPGLAGRYDCRLPEQGYCNSGRRIPGMQRQSVCVHR